MRVCIACGGAWPKKARNQIVKPTCACGSRISRTVAPPGDKIAPRSALTFEQQRQLYEAARERTSGTRNP